ncbi:MAG TPA: hypothetical protein VF592_05855 [Sphingomonas sp.]|jgi:hypothetical protein|uniref:hypothetical protein n=1 Tax=Sphingomonas sp. TaxID=28214 RepID=UPI002ED842D4
MSWNYRIIDHGTHLALHEVYYDAAGRPTAWTAEPADFLSNSEDGTAGITDALTMALRDATTRSVLRPVEQVAQTTFAPSRTAAAWVLYGVGVLASKLDWGALYQAAMRRSSDAQGRAHGPWRSPARLVEVDSPNFDRPLK